MAVEDDAEHKQSLLVGDEAAASASGDYKTYHRRWWVLFCYATFSCLQGWTWAVPGSVSDTYTDLYAITPDSVELQLNYGALLFLPVAIPVGWWMDARVNGVKHNLWIGALLVLVASIARCLATDASSKSVAMLHLSAILIALAGPISMSAVSKLSEEWFPPGQRALATSVAATANGAGSTLSAIVGPQMVVANTWSSLQVYNYLMLGLVAFNTACIFAYFPARPPTPPSRTAALAHAKHHSGGFGAAGDGSASLTVWQVLARLCRNKDFLILTAVYGIAGGMQAGFGGIMVLDVSNVGIDQTAAGWLAFTSSITGNVVGVTLGHLADRFRHLGRIAVTGTVVGAAATFYIVLALQSALPAAWMTLPRLLPQLYVAYILSTGVNAVQPLLFELAVESSHPLPIATVITAMTFAYNAGAAVILSIPIGYPAALNWAYGATIVALALLLLFSFRESSRRFAVDAAATEEDAAALQHAEEDEVYGGVSSAPAAAAKGGADAEEGDAAALLTLR
jgi:MFS family permease